MKGTWSLVGSFYPIQVLVRTHLLNIMHNDESATHLHFAAVYNDGIQRWTFSPLELSAPANSCYRWSERISIWTISQVMFINIYNENLYVANDIER